MQEEQRIHVAPVAALLTKADELTKSGEIHAAVQALEAALELDPESSWAWAHHGDLLYQQLGLYEQALVSFTRAIQLDSKYAWAVAHRGATHERLDAFAEAEVDLKAALELKPNYTWALAMLGRVYQMTQRFESAFHVVEQVVALDRDLLPYWREERAMMRMLVGRHEEAAHFFQLAFEADPEDRFAHYNSVVNLVRWRGVVAARDALGKLRQRLERAVRSSPDRREVDRATYEIGGVCALEGETEQALRQLRQANERESGLVLLSPGRKRAIVDMAWSELRADPRFVAAIARNGCN